MCCAAGRRRLQRQRHCLRRLPSVHLAGWKRHRKRSMAIQRSRFRCLFQDGGVGRVTWSSCWPLSAAERLDRFARARDDALSCRRDRATLGLRPWVVDRRRGGLRMIRGNAESGVHPTRRRCSTDVGRPRHPTSPQHSATAKSSSSGSTRPSPGRASHRAVRTGTDIRPGPGERRPASSLRAGRGENGAARAARGMSQTQYCGLNTFPRVMVATRQPRLARTSASRSSSSSRAAARGARRRASSPARRRSGVRSRARAALARPARLRSTNHSRT